MNKLPLEPRVDPSQREHHEIMEKFRGRELRVKAAEAFVRLVQGHGGRTLPAPSDGILAGSQLKTNDGSEAISD